MILLASALALAIAAPAQARWTKLFDEAEESTFVDLSSARRGQGETLIWIRHDFPRARGQGIRSVRDQWLVNCRARTFTMFALVSYDGRGRIVKAEAIRAEQRHAAPIVAGSRMDRVFRAVCG
jgi:hypothetical protein